MHPLSDRTVLPGAPLRVHAPVVSNSADVLVDEFLGAVGAALRPGHPIAAPFAALPRPVPYIDPDAGYGRGVLTRRSIEKWLHPFVVQAGADDAAFADVLNAFESLDLSLVYREQAEDAERWAPARTAGPPERTAERLPVRATATYGRGDGGARCRARLAARWPRHRTARRGHP
jgi:hypothetical protein